MAEPRVHITSTTASGDDPAVMVAVRDRMVEAFGAGRVTFRAFASGVVAPDRSFRPRDVLLLLIEPKFPYWHLAAATDLRREIDDTRATGVKILPLLVNGALMLAPDDLPPALDWLARRRPTVLHPGERLTEDLDRLVADLR